MVNKYTLGSIVFGIFLLAIFGIRSAASWLAQSNTQADTSGRIAAVSDSNNVNRLSDNRTAASGNSTNQTNSRNTTLSQSDRTDEIGADGTSLTATEAAGQYIQRQKRVPGDEAVANTDFEAIPSASNSVTAQNNTTSTPQPTRTATPSPSPSPRPATPTPARPTAVPALW
jgi:hypothetical protein